MARGDPLKPIEQWHEIRENDFLENLTFRRPFVRKFFTSNIVRRTLAHLFARYGSSSLPLQATTQGYLKVTGMNGLQKHLHYEAQADDIIPEAGQPCSIITQTPPVFGMSRRVANFPNAAASAGTIWVPVIHDNWDGASLDINIHAYSDTACVSGVSDDVDWVLEMQFQYRGPLPGEYINSCGIQLSDLDAPTQEEARIITFSDVMGKTTGAIGDIADTNMWGFRHGTDRFRLHRQ